MNDSRGVSCLDPRVVKFAACVEAGFERAGRQLRRRESRTDYVESEVRSFRVEFERRVAPLKRSYT